MKYKYKVYLCGPTDCFAKGKFKNKVNAYNFGLDNNPGEGFIILNLETKEKEIFPKSSYPTKTEISEEDFLIISEKYHCSPNKKVITITTQNNYEIYLNQDGTWTLSYNPSGLEY